MKFNTKPLKYLRFRNNVNGANVQTGNNAKRMKFQIKGLDNIISKCKSKCTFCIESVNILILYDQNDETKSLGQTIIRMANLSSINCFDTHGDGKTDPVLFTAETQTKQPRLGTTTTNAAYQNTEQTQVFYNPYPEMLYNFPMSSNFLE